MRILIVTDAWHHQQNGVVRTLDMTKSILEKWGHEIMVIHPGLFRTVPYPLYPEIRVPIHVFGMFKKIRKFSPHAIHIATESRLGVKVRNWCVRNGRAFTTSYHTKFPEYIEEYFSISANKIYPYMRWFHKKSEKVMVNTQSLKEDLEKKGFKNLVMWGRGVDTELFYPRQKKLDLQSPVWMNVGRVSYEKNLEAFLSIDLPGTKVVVGDGPARKELQEKYPNVLFLGKKSGEELAQSYNEADVFVFPSVTDTFGLVMLEAIACGKPVAAFNVTGPRDVIKNGINGILSNDLQQSCLDAIKIPSEQVLSTVKDYQWETCTKQFLDNLYPTAGDML